MRHVAPGNYSAEIAISSWQLCYGIGSEAGFSLSLAGQFSLRNPSAPATIEVHEVTLCAAHSTREYLSQGMTIAPATIGVIDIESGVEGAVAVPPGDPVTMFNLLEAGHRPPLLLEGMIDESECFRVTHLRFFIISR